MQREREMLLYKDEMREVLTNSGKYRVDPHTHSQPKYDSRVASSRAAGEIELGVKKPKSPFVAEVRALLGVFSPANGDGRMPS